ncbi:type I restriction-modification enzyme S subunit, partial [Acetobacter tropicalis]
MLPDGWKRTTLAAILLDKVKNGYSPNATEKPTGYWVLGLGSLGVERLNFLESKPVEPTKEVISSLIRQGDFLISRSNTPEKVGRISLVREVHGNYSYPDLMIRFRPNPLKADSTFLELQMKSVSFRNYIKKNAAGSSGTMVKINKTILEHTPILLPPLPEQKKIAAILSTWDRAIEGTEKLLANSQQQKKALMQQLLTGKKRLPGFSGEWKKTTIGNIAKEISIRNKNRKNYPVISCTKTKGFVDSLSFFNKKVYSDDLSGYKIISRNQIGFPSNHIEEGSIGLQNLHDDAIVSPIYTVFSMGKNADPLFVFAVLKTDHYRQIFAAATNSSVDRRG